MTTKNFKSTSFYLMILFLVLSSINLSAQNKSQQQSVFVLVHGAWHGGWCWDKVKEKLSAQGNDVYTPTLSGMAEKKDQLDGTIDLNTHIQDIIDLIVKEDLHHVILVGHSYAGLVISGVADKIPERLDKLIYLDALLAENGQSAFSVNPKESQEVFLKTAMDHDKGLSIPPPSSTWFGVSDSAAIKWTDERLTSQPYKTFSQPLVLKHPYGNHLPLTYIACTNPELPVLIKFAEKAKNNEAWKYFELKTGHDAMVTIPVELAELLYSLK